MSKVKRTVAPVANTTPEPTKSRLETSASKVVNTNLLFGKRNYYYMLGGLGLIFLGLILMAGGHMPSPDVWDDSIIYSARRTVLAPILILAGLAMQVVAIFSKKEI
jgi:hypothetical protein